MLEYREEPFSQVQPEIAVLMHEHWPEVRDDPNVPLDVDWAKFFQLERIGMLFVLAVRHRGDLVGYSILITAHALHYRTKLFAHDDAFFLKKEHRKGFAGMKMIREVEKMMKRHGAVRVIWHQKTMLDNGKVFAFLGYENKEVLWMKNI